MKPFQRGAFFLSLPAGLSSGSVFEVAAVDAGERRIGAIEGEIAVINLKREDRQRGQKEPAAAAHAPAVGLRRGRIPTPGGMAAVDADLHRDQTVAHALVPSDPSLASHVVQELGGVVPIINVPLLRLSQVRGDQTDPLDQFGVLGGPAEILAAEQGLGGHRRAGTAAGHVGVKRSLVRVDRGDVEIVAQSLIVFFDTVKPAKRPLRKAINCQPKTDVSPMSPGS